MTAAKPNSAQATDIACLLHPFTNPLHHEETGPLIVERGEGVHVCDADGRRYVETMAGLCCVGLGWSEERLVAAAAAQMRKLAYYHTFMHRSHPTAIELARRLVAMAPAPMSKAFFANSGSEANDIAVKLIRCAHAGRGRPGKTKIVTQRHGYHGTTLASGAMTGLDYAHDGFGPLPPGFLHVDAPDCRHGAADGEDEEAFAARLAQQLDDLIVEEGEDTVAAFFAEPVAVTGGMIVPPAAYFDKVQAVLRKRDVLFAVDEAICGFGRTGRMFGSETFGLKPDVVTVAKQLSSAYVPISAVLLNDTVYEGIRMAAERIPVLGAGFTCSAHPVAAAVALEVLDIYEERGIVAYAARTGAHMQARLAALADHPLVGDVRGVGMLAGVELVKDKARGVGFRPESWVAGKWAEFAARRGLLIRPLTGDIVGLAPPLVMTIPELDAMLDGLAAALDDTLRWVGETAPS